MALTHTFRIICFFLTIIVYNIIIFKNMIHMIISFKDSLFCYSIIQCLKYLKVSFGIHNMYLYNFICYFSMYILNHKLCYFFINRDLLTIFNKKFNMLGKS